MQTLVRHHLARVTPVTRTTRLTTAPPSYTSLPILISSCSTTVPLLVPYYMISPDPQKQSTTPSDLLYTTLSKQTLHVYDRLLIVSCLFPSRTTYIMY